MKQKLTRIAAAVLLMSVLTSCGASREAKNVQEMIDRIPDTYSSEIDEDIVNARTALDKLDEKDRKTVEAAHLEKLEEEYRMHYQQAANEMNKKIDSLDMSWEYIPQMVQVRKNVEEIIQETEKMPDFANDQINYDVFLEKIQNESSRVADILADANDILVMEDIFEKLQSINSAYSVSAKYSHACDIESDIDNLSDRFNRKNLWEAAQTLTSACLNENEIEILTAPLDSFYSPFLSDDTSTFLDDCLKWQEIIQERMGE